MKTRIVPSSSEKLNEIQRLIAEVAFENEEKLIRHLYIDKDYTLLDIATVLGVSKQALSKRYPALAKEKNV